MVEKRVWGNATWYLFHTLSYKLKYDNEKNVKKLYKLFENICHNLPCPICSEHAVNLLKKINYNNLVNKNNLILVMFHLHNKVNEKLNKKIFTIEEHNELYSKANVSNIINFFLTAWNAKTYEGLNFKSIEKKNCINNLKKFINENENFFM